MPVKKMDMPPLMILKGPIDYRILEPRRRYRFSYRVSTMPDGAQLSLPVMVVVGTADRPRLACVAGIHGDEHEGVASLLDLWDELDPSTLQGTLVMVPVANPPAFRAGERANPMDIPPGVDMNRAFPGKADGDTTQQLAYHLFHGILSGADLVLSMHGWSQDALVLPYAEYPLGYPVTDASQAAAYAFGVDFVKGFAEGEWPNGVVGEACCKSGMPVIETEIGGLGCTMPERRALYKRGVHNLLRHLGIEPGGSDTPHTASEICGFRMVHATQGGALRRRVEVGDEIQDGGCLAVVTDLTGGILTSIVADKGGLVGAIRLRASVCPGQLVAIIWRLQRPLDAGRPTLT